MAEPADWFDPLPHTHAAPGDAIGQGALFYTMLADRHSRFGGRGK